MFFGDRSIRVLFILVALQGWFFTTQALAHGRHHHGRHSAAALPRSDGARVIQCVAFAKWDAGIDISGNARDWWMNAAGVYERGARPEIGSVLSFRPNARMPLGHVAVVAEISDSRTITIDQSHWNSRGITRDIQVKDVSEENDWSAVRVQVARGGQLGSIYPTHGFIYPRPDASLPAATAITSAGSLRLAGGHHTQRGKLRPRSLEVAEAPAAEGPLDLTVGGLGTDAPNRAFR